MNLEAVDYTLKTTEEILEILKTNLAKAQNRMKQTEDKNQSDLHLLSGTGFILSYIPTDKS